MKKLGIYLRKLRKEKNLTLVGLGKKVGVSYGTIHRIEYGRSVKLQTIFKLMDFFKEESQEICRLAGFPF
jgi:transcriptional regulator with XRE-family HTH domain